MALFQVEILHSEGVDFVTGSCLEYVDEAVGVAEVSWPLPMSSIVLGSSTRFLGTIG